jgi:4-carboxymuconolactone decarboxylase
MAPSAEVENLLERLAQVSEKGAYRASEVKYLDPRTLALVMVGAAICMDAPSKTFQALVGSALQAGATNDEVIGAMLAVAPAAGEPRIVAVAPKVALALGYDVDAAFENE